MAEKPEFAYKQYLPTIKKLVPINAALILYFLFPNITSYATFMLLILYLLVQNGSEKMQKLLSHCDQCNVSEYFNTFTKNRVSHQLVVLVLIGVFVQFSRVMGSSVWIVILAEIYACWDLLVGFGLVEMAMTTFQRIDEALNKFIQMIPKYEK